MSTRLMSVASTMDAHNNDDLRERAEIRAELDNAANTLVVQIEKAVYAYAAEQGVSIASHTRFLVTDQAFTHAQRWVTGDSVDAIARRIVKVLA